MKEEVSTDSSTGEIYIPNETEENLEVDENAYNTLEYISLEWPAQSFDLVNNNEIVLGTNPATGTPSLIKLDFSKTENFENMKNFEVKKMAVKNSFNKIKFRKILYCLSDDTLNLYDKDLNEEIIEIKGDFGYGLNFGNNVFGVGTKNGELILHDYKFNEISKTKIHDNIIEGIYFKDNSVYTSSNDHSVKCTDIRSMNEVFCLKYSCDVNCVSHNNDNKLLFGDDEGVLRLVDLRNINNVEEIKWHKTPISCVVWGSRDVFASASDKQVCIWDTTFLDEWEYHKYLSFVHQGQSFYKDVHFLKDDCNFLITTALEGICIFSPKIKESDY